MKAKKFLTLSMLVVLAGLFGGCHELSRDRYRYSSGYGSYRDGFRDGRAYEKRREGGWPYSRYGYYDDYRRRR
jgi:hypothetical protein